MSKRKLVPAALHSELTEYSSLLRALRTSNTLDVASHMARPGPSHIDPEELNSDDDVDDDELKEAENMEEDYDTETVTNLDVPASSVYDSRDVSPSQTAGPSSPTDTVTRSSSQKRKRNSSSPPPQRRRDAWTRWPLLVDDVHVPEWSLEDEVGLLVAHASKLHPRPRLPTVESEDLNESEHDVEGWDIDTDPSFVRNLTNAVSNHLSTILALLVTHTPNRSQGMQNRVEPMDWRAVLDVLSSCGDPSIADPKIIDSVKSRMEASYGSPIDNDKSASDVLGMLITTSVVCEVLTHVSDTTNTN
ncbi:hypothetical protein FPV67DRAFT_1418777 [Lyophyllum atratum]|nr:hypothetical protein FPV67DRAFT_1418777 [Lyophyllum atratum]